LESIILNFLKITLKKYMKRIITTVSCTLLFAFLLFSNGLLLANNFKKTYKADVIIYGGTPAAIVAAVEIVRSGKTAIIVSPDVHLGGLSSSGLGFTDTGNKDAIGGLAREFYRRVYLHYQQEKAWKWQKKNEYGNQGQGTAAMDGENRTMWIFEPHVAESIFEAFVKENNITVLRDEWLDREKGVTKKAGKIG